MTPATPNRRTVLTALGVGLATAGCGSADPARPAGTSEGESRPAPDCVLTPEGTEGPYYVDTDLVRGDIREGRPGVPLRLRIAVVNATSCDRLPAAAVDIWHADAHGSYSGVEDDSRFLRGIQHTDRSGVAAFSTIFPGWYDNRTVHIHVKVHIGGDEVHTGQLYFSEKVTAEVAAVAPYTERADPRTDNDHDFLFRRSDDQPLLAVAGRATSGYQADITIGVNA